MQESKPERQPPRRAVRTAVGAGSRFPVVLVEASGVLGVLVAESQRSDSVFDDVLYFRSVLGTPFAQTYQTVELSNQDGFYVARVSGEREIFYEPSKIPYAIEVFTKSEFDDFVDDVVAYRTESAEAAITKLFGSSEGFSLSEQGQLVPPLDYAGGLDRFLLTSSFVEPRSPTEDANG